MANNSDKQLMEHYVSWCARRGLTQTQMGILVKRTKGWASLLVKGKIQHLQFLTRNRIKSILGESYAIDGERGV